MVLLIDYSLQVSQHDLPSVVQAGTLSQILGQWRNITSNTFVANMAKGHHLQLRCHPLVIQ